MASYPLCIIKQLSQNGQEPLLNKIRRKMKGWGLPLSHVANELEKKDGTTQKRIAPATKRIYANTCQRMIEFFGQDVFVESITRDEYAEWHDWLAERGTSEVTVNDYRRNGRAIWNHLKKRGFEVANIEGITATLKEPIQHSKAITDDILHRILEVASIRDMAIVLFMAASGMRRQSVGRITVDRIKIWQRPDGRFNMIASIPAEKTSAPRELMGDHDSALACQLWLSVRKHKESPWLFNSTRDGEQLSENSVSSIFRKLRIKANLPAGLNISPHSLRHRAAQRMLDDFDARVVADFLGISVETLLQVYAVRSREDLIIQRFGDLPPDW